MEVSVDTCRWFEAFCDPKPSDPLTAVSDPWHQETEQANRSG